MMRMMRQRLLVGVAAIWLVAGGSARAQEAHPDDDGEAARADITVIGTRAAGRGTTDSPVPIDVIRGDAIRQAGANGELAQSLATLLPAFNFPRQSNSGVGDTVRAAQLRGLSPDQILVLVNGKRYHPTATTALDAKIGRGTAPVDFNTLPVGGVARLDVLRDGAGAQYGSDAIAGVVDIGLDRLDHGAAAGITYGGNVTRPDALDRTLHDGRTAVIDLKAGTRLGETGFLTLGGDYGRQQGTNRAGYDRGGQYLSNGSYADPRNDAFFGRRLFKVGDPRVDSGHLWFNAESAGDDGVTLYSFGILHLREAAGANFFRWPVIVDGKGDDYVAPGQPGNGFLPQSLVRNGDLSVTAGVRGIFGGWKVDGSVTYGGNWIRYRLRDSLNYSLGAASPTAFLLSRTRSDQLVGNLDVSRDYDLGLASPVTLAAGLEYRHERWRSRPGDAASYAVGPLADPASLGLQPGAQAGPGLTPDDARSLGRDVVAGYAEASADLLPGVLADVAGRIEHYSDAGTAVAGKAAVRWAIAPGLAVRGSVSNSFRAPGLAQLGTSATSLSFGEGGQLRRVSTLPVDSPAARGLGARDLRPERSVNLSGGITTTPVPGLRLSVDVFQILIDDRITLSERFDLSAVTPSRRSALGLATYDAINFFTNAVDLKTRGIDAVADYRRTYGGTTIGLSAAYSYARNTIRRVTAPPAQLAANGIGGGLIGLEETNTLETAAPRDKIILSADAARGAVSGLVRGVRFGSVEHVFDFGGGFTPRQRFGAAWSLDAELSLAVRRGLTVSVGGNNLLDRYPDRSIDDFNGAGNLAYDPLSPIGINGRFLYVRARVTL
ncbi:TonB-dependent receptor [Sphingomonas sp. 2SG]|uniref:TonB-dependent receptor plug domain-containing protein n=1 Tax=Sphingomonas sp. 2SG TaxID=2502201 RepID=UPI0014851243|nr:TonB-dependent receptor [Sphingomonas sp. 2SG]